MIIANITGTIFETWEGVQFDITVNFIKDKQGKVIKLKKDKAIEAIEEWLEKFKKKIEEENKNFAYTSWELSLRSDISDLSYIDFVSYNFSEGEKKVQVIGKDYKNGFKALIKTWDNNFVLDNIYFESQKTGEETTCNVNMKIENKDTIIEVGDDIRVVVKKRE